MTVEVRVATESDLDRWNDYVGRSPHGTLFHEHETLELLADHAGARLHPLVGEKGQETVGLFPVFEISRRPLTATFSPPPFLRIPYLGPALLNLEKLKRRKRERRQQQFLENCFEWIETELNPRYEHVRTGPGFADSRPFKWNGYDVTPRYTYAVDLSLPGDELLKTFSSDARTNVTKTPDGSYSLEEGGPDSIREILALVSNRYESQGIGFHLTDEFVIDLYEGTANGAVRPYTVSVDGEFVGGILALEYGDSVLRWQGGVRTDDDVDVPINDLLDWAVMSDGRDRGLSTYDLVGADTRRINRYKAKFNPALRTYYRIERGSWGVQKLARLYRSIK